MDYEDNSEKYLMYTDKWVERFMRQGLWDSLFPDNYELWIENFDEDEQLTARYLIDGLVYYNSRDIASIISWCFDECIRRLCVRNLPSLAGELIAGNPGISDRWSKIRDDVLKTLYVCPAFTDKPDASSYTVYRLLTTSNPLIDDNNKCELGQIGYLSSSGKCKTLVLVDDIVGSGKQALKNWYETDKYVSSVYEPLAATVERHNIECYLLVVVGCYDGLQTLEKKTDLKIIAGERIPNYMSVLNPSFWPENGEPHIDRIKKIAETKAIPLRGYKKKSWSIAFSHGMPNVSCPLYYSKSPTWNPLYIKAKKG